MLVKGHSSCPFHSLTQELTTHTVNRGNNTRVGPCHDEDDREKEKDNEDKEANKRRRVPLSRNKTMSEEDSSFEEAWFPSWSRFIPSVAVFTVIEDVVRTEFHWTAAMLLGVLVTGFAVVGLAISLFKPKDVRSMSKEYEVALNTREGQGTTKHIGKDSPVLPNKYPV